MIAISSLFSASVGCLLKVKWAPKCYLLFSIFIFFCLSQDFIFPFEAYGVYFLCVTSSPHFLFCFSFSFPLLFKFHLCNSLEFHAGDTWLVYKFSRVTNETSLGAPSLLIPRAKHLPKCCRIALGYLSLREIWGVIILWGILQGKPGSRKIFDLMERIIIDSCPLEPSLKANKMYYFQ